VAILPLAANTTQRIPAMEEMKLSTELCVAKAVAVMTAVDMNSHANSNFVQPLKIETIDAVGLIAIVVISFLSSCYFASVEVTSLCLVSLLYHSYRL
jgi:hypothetical protein